jgi:NDP-sugar pyrophosphorylase family protein
VIERAVILAIGSPNYRSMLTYNRAHAMLPALGKPLVARVMDRLHRAGIREYTIVVGENEGAVAAYLNTQWVPNAKIDFVLKSGPSSLLDILMTVAHRDSRPFMLASYNSYTHHHFPESLLRQHGDFERELILSGATNTLSKSPSHYYAVMDGQRVRDVTQNPQSEQTIFTLTDMAVCGSSFVQFLSDMQGSPSGSFDWELMDIARHYIQSGGVAVVTETNWILQIEADRDLLTLNKLLLNEGHDSHILSELPYTVQIIPPVRIDPQVSVGQGVKIGPHVYLERGCSIAHGVVLRNTIVLERATVPARKAVYDTIISTRGPIP